VSRHHRPAGALTTVVVATLVITFGLSGSAAADDYPSWDDVQAAKQNEATAQAAINEIEGILVALEAEANTLGRVAQQRAEEYNAAVAELDKAAARADRLENQAEDAAAQATESSQRAAQLLAQLARSGGGSLTLDLFLSPNPDDLLGSIGTMSKVSEQATSIYKQAQQDANVADALTEQAQIAEEERSDLADSAEEALSSAQAAADEAAARVSQQQAASDQLYAQLADLKGTRESVEQEYLIGLTAEQEQAAQPPPPAPGPAPNPTPPAPNTSAVAGAIAFAYAQLGEPYLFAGAGPDAWDCSGLTKAAYASVGVYIGQHLVSSQYYTMANQGRLVPLSDMVPGDLIYYANGGYAGGGFYHVTMYVGNGQMIEAPRPGVPVRVTGVRYYDALPYAGRPTP